MERITLSFGRDKTAIIKGIAIVFMIMLHCGVGDVFKLCVGIFTFMVGYGYAFAREKDWRYSLKHIRKLLVPFWVILFVFTFPAMLLLNEKIELSKFLLNLFGINSEYNFFSWFVAFFIYAMVAFPFLSRIIDKRPVFGTIILIIIAWVLEAAVHSISGMSDNDWTQRLFDCLLCTPGMLLGYLFAHKRWFTSITISKHWSMLLVVALLLASVFSLRPLVGSVVGFNLDFFYAPLFILAVLMVFNLYKLPVMSKVLTTIGNVSVYMWFFHALFFTKVVSAIYEPLIRISDSLWFMTLWTILLTFVCSWGISKVVDF